MNTALKKYIWATLLLVVLSTINVVPVKAANNLMGHWNFNEGQGNIVTDLSSNGYEGKIRGARWINNETCIDESCLLFDGNNDFIDLKSLNIRSQAFTISVWINPQSFNTYGDNRIISKASGTSAQEHDWMLSTIKGNDEKIYLRFRLKTNGQTTTLADSSSEIPSNQWTLVTATYDGSNMKLYKNGTFLASTAKSGLVNRSSNKAWIGRNPDGYGPFHGKIDDVRIYKTALTDQQITDLFDEFNNTEPVCGNNIIEEGEFCDSDIQNCITSDDYPGTQTCNETCSEFDQCITDLFCGNGICDGPENTLSCPSDCPTASECNDGFDNDGDGAIDASDFSCINSFDNDESLPLSQCQDGIDNDEDGLVDLNDPHCSNNQDNSENGPPSNNDYDEGDIFNVSINGSGNHSGNSADNAMSFNEALSFAQANPNTTMTFYLADGNYGSLYLSNSRTKWVTFKSQNPLQAMFTGATIECNNCNSFIRFDGLTIYEPDPGACPSKADAVNILHIIDASFIEVLNSKIYAEETPYNANNGIRIIRSPGNDPLDMQHFVIDHNEIFSSVQGISHVGRDVVITNNNIHKVHSSLITANYIGNNIPSNGNVTVTGNHLHNQQYFSDLPCFIPPGCVNGDNNCWSSEHGNGIGLRGADEVLIANNVIHNAWIAMLRFYQYQVYGNVTVKNNFMYDIAHSILSDVGSSTNFTGNVIYEHNTIIPGTQNPDWTPDLVTYFGDPDLDKRFINENLYPEKQQFIIPKGNNSTIIRNNLILADLNIYANNYQASNNIVYAYVWNFDGDLFESTGNNYAIAEWVLPSGITAQQAATFIDDQLFADPLYQNRYHEKNCKPFGNDNCDFTPKESSLLCNPTNGGYIGAFTCQ